jgi:hypothetical protein
VQTQRNHLWEVEKIIGSDHIQGKERQFGIGIDPENDGNEPLEQNVIQRVLIL